MILDRSLKTKVFWIFYFDVVSCRLRDQTGLETPVVYTVNKDCFHIYKYEIMKKINQPENYDRKIKS